MKTIQLIAIIIIALVINFPIVSSLAISNVNASPGQSSANVTWATDEASDSKVDYGESPSLGQSKEIVESVENHSVELKDLDENTPYYYKVKSGEVTEDNSGELYQFATLAAPALTEIANLSAELGIGSIKITWKTNVEADSKVYYGKDKNNLSQKSNSSKVLWHSVEIADLEKGVNYFYYAESSDGTATIRAPAEFNEATTLEEVSVIQLDKLPAVVNTNRFTITGKTEPGSVVKFFVSNIASEIESSEMEILEGGYAIQTDSAGKINATIFLNSGANDILVVSQSGFKIDKETVGVYVDADAPELYVAGILSPRKEPSFSIIGSIKENATVKYSIYKIKNNSVEEVVKANQTVDASQGTFNVSVNLGAQVEGKYKVVVTATDSVGNTAENAKTIDVDNKPPELIEVNVPQETHFNIIRITGKVSEPGATVIIKNLAQVDAVETEQENAGENQNTYSQVYIDPLGELIGYDNRFQADENGEFLGRVALMPGSNQIAIQVMDAAGNINAQRTETVSFTSGNPLWRVGRITTVPNCVYTDNLKAGNVGVSLMFYLYYIGPTLGTIRVRGVTVTKDGAEEDNSYIGESWDTKYFYDEENNENQIFVYTTIPIKQFTGDAYSLPDQMDFALKATVTYDMLEPSGTPIEQELPGSYGEIDLSPVYFEAAVAVEKPLKYTKWLTPRMINKTIKIIDIMLNPLETAVKFAGKLSMITMGACAVYTFASYFMEPDYKTLYTICDRVQCPYVPPACEAFGKSFDWKNSETGQSISDSTYRRYNPPEKSQASESKPYYKNKQTGELLFEEPAGQTENYEKVTQGEYYVLERAEIVNGVLVTKSYPMDSKKYERYMYDYDVYEKEGGNWAGKRSGETLGQSEYEKQKAESTVTDAAKWKQSPVYFSGATPTGRYTIEYMDKDEVEKARVAGERVVCPNNMPNAVVTYSTSKGNLMGIPGGSVGVPAVWNTNVNIADYGYRVQCTDMDRSKFESGEPLIQEGVSRCFTPGPDAYDETRCLDQSVRDANPFDDIVVSTRCGCISGVRGNLNNIARVLQAMKTCMKQAYIGQVRGGYCERLVAQFACDFIIFAIQKSVKPKSGEARIEGRLPDANFKSNMDEVNERLNNRYQGTFTSQMGLDSKELVHKTCISAISGDWTTFRDIVNVMGSAPVEPVIGPLMPESRLTSYDPFTGGLTIHYLFTLGIMSGGQDIEYEVMLECDPDYYGGESCPRNRAAQPIIYNGYVPREGIISENVPIVIPNSIYWYNKATLTVKYDLGTEQKVKQLVEPIVHKGGLIAQCHIGQAPFGGIECETLVPEGLGVIEVGTIGLTPMTAKYYPGNIVALKMMLRKAGEPPKDICVYWELKKPIAGEDVGKVEESIITSNEAGNAEELTIKTAGLSQEFSQRNQYLFKFGEGTLGITTVMHGEESVNLALEQGKGVEITAKEKSEGNEIERDIASLAVTAEKESGGEFEMNCERTSPKMRTCKNKLTEKITIKKISIDVKSENPVTVYRKVEGEEASAWFDATAKREVGAEFPPGAYGLDLGLYKAEDCRNVNPQYDELLKFEKRELKFTFTMDYKNEKPKDCGAEPVVEIINPFEPGAASAKRSSEATYSDSSSFMWFWDNSSVEANVLDDCNEIDKIELMITDSKGNTKSYKGTLKEGLTQVVGNLGTELQQYEEGERLELQIKATDKAGKEGTSQIVPVLRKKGTETTG